ncbi:hypothetical protein MSPP1_000046 [Malassezia sp. CBS 17886]|nr:hypothetical protein MSPP1_000046 [Malassezia sp. CBS 17886]
MRIAPNAPWPAPRDAAACRIPIEVWVRILCLLDPEEVVRCRQTSRLLHRAGSTYALWRRFCASLAGRVPVPTIPDIYGGDGATSAEPATDAARHLEHAVLTARRLAHTWTTSGCIPRRVLRFRAHVNRITSLRLVTGATTATRSGRVHIDRWLITGSVDGFARVWDVSKVLRQRGAMDVTPEYSVHESVPTFEDTSTHDELDDGARPRGSMDVPSTADDPAWEIKRSARAVLVAEIDTGGDVTALDAELDRENMSMTIAVGSYYNSAGCLIYHLELRTLPHFLDHRASLDPPQWCGTQCVSLRRGVVAVGTYMGTLHIFNWKSGWRRTIERAERGSIAALKLYPSHALVVTRLGVLETHRLPTDETPSTETEPSQPLAQYQVTTRPLLSVSFGEQEKDPWEGVPDGKQPRALWAPLSLLVVDVTGLTHLELMPCAEAGAFPYMLPPHSIAHVAMHGERLIGASIGMQGRRAIVASSLGGVPPVCTLRAYARTDATGVAPILFPLRATPDIGMPVDGARTQPRGAPASGSTIPSPSSRFDMLTESVLDEAHGLVCLASVRGAVWIADYGGYTE